MLPAADDAVPVIFTEDGGIVLPLSGGTEKIFPGWLQECETEQIF